MLSSTQQRIESLLTTIDRLGIVKIKHLQQIHDLKSYRNACRVVNQLKPYVHETFFEREKVIYLNKEGLELIGSEKGIKKTPQMAHSLLRNEVYIHFGCPYDWQNEYTLEANLKPPSNFEIQCLGLKLNNKKKVICDAVFKRNGYFHLIEVDHTQSMLENKRKIEAYREVLPHVKGNVPILYFFTTTETRKRKFEELLKGMRFKVHTFEEIK